MLYVWIPGCMTRPMPCTMRFVITVAPCSFSLPAAPFPRSMGLTHRDPQARARSQHLLTALLDAGCGPQVGMNWCRHQVDIDFRV